MAGRTFDVAANAGRDCTVLDGHLCASRHSAGRHRALHEAVLASTRSPAITAKLREQGLEPLSMSMVEMQDKVRKESDFMKEFLRAVKLDFNS